MRTGGYTAGVRGGISQSRLQRFVEVVHTLSERRWSCPGCQGEEDRLSPDSAQHACELLIWTDESGPYFSSVGAT